MSPMLQRSCGEAGEEMARWKSIPKIELHAHLNGCVRPSTLFELASEEGRTGTTSVGDIGYLIREGFKSNASLADCFRLFPLIHGLTTDHAIVTRITKEAIEDFFADNVVYLELRTTPKRNEAHGMTKRSYVEAVLAGFEAAGVSPCSKNGLQRSEVQAKPNRHVRLLLSIDRRESAEAAMDTVLLAWELRNRGVVGIDLSGNPTVGQWQTFLPALNWAKQRGMPLTLHCGEIFNSEEVRSMLAIQPQRLGHVCCLEKPEWSALLESNIPVEICLTSNVRSRSVRSIYDHHFAALHKAKHPTILCTDDPGLFSTCLSHEYSLAATCFGLSEEDILRMGKNAVEYTFAEEQLKQTLRKIFEEAMTKTADLQQ
ncbi:unnamed protein product [Calypogeia fissa]